MFWFFWIIFCIVCWIPFGVKYYGAERSIPVAGASNILLEAIDNPFIEEEEVEIVSEKQEEVIDIACWKSHTAKSFRRMGIVKYGNYTYTFYSEKVLPGGGLKIPNRHVEYIDGLGFVCDKDGYIVVASDDLKKGIVVNTPVGRKGKIYDCGSGKGNLDLYVSW